MDEKRGIERWGYGIPQYTKEDVLEGEELIKFGMDILWQNEFEGKDHRVIEATSKPGVIPNVVCEIDGKLSFIVVKVAAYPDDAVLSVEEKKHFLAHSAKYKAESYFAPISLMSEDLVRANAGLLKKHKWLDLHRR